MDSCKDSEKCYVILKFYKDHRKAVELNARLPAKWPLMEVKMLFIKRTSTDIRAEGELMNRRRFLQWSTALFFLSKTYLYLSCVFYLDVRVLGGLRVRE